jgi:hypothetical protein
LKRYARQPDARSSLSRRHSTQTSRRTATGSRRPNNPPTARGLSHDGPADARDFGRGLAGPTLRSVSAGRVRRGMVGTRSSLRSQVQPLRVGVALGSSARLRLVPWTDRWPPLRRWVAPKTRSEMPILAAVVGKSRLDPLESELSRRSVPPVFPPSSAIPTVPRSGVWPAFGGVIPRVPLL